MLVLTVKEGDFISIGQDQKVHILSLRGNRIKLGLEAPLEVKILRHHQNGKTRPQGNK